MSSTQFCCTCLKSSLLCGGFDLAMYHTYEYMYNKNAKHQIPRGQSLYHQCDTSQQEMTGMKASSKKSANSQSKIGNPSFYLLYLVSIPRWTTFLLYAEIQLFILTRTPGTYLWNYELDVGTNIFYQHYRFQLFVNVSSA